MSSLAKLHRELRHRRHRRIRKKVRGTAERPRLCVFRSLKHVYAQIIDDGAGVCLMGISSLMPEIRSQIDGMRKTEASRRVGLVLAQRAKEKGIETVCFDRGGYLYHGRVRALAEGAREGGLKF